MKNLKKFNESFDFKEIYAIVSKKSEGEDAIVYIFDSFEKAMNSSIWEEFDEEPNDKGESRIFKICKFDLNRDFNGML